MKTSLLCSFLICLVKFRKALGYQNTTKVQANWTEINKIFRLERHGSQSVDQASRVIKMIILIKSGRDAGG